METHSLDASTLTAKGRVMTVEDAIHIAIVSWLGIALPKNAIFWHTPNTFPSAKIQFHAKLKRMGRLAGIPDLFVFSNDKLVGLEVKSKSGSQSKEQRFIEQAVMDNGGAYYVVRSIDDAKEALILEGVI